MARLNGKRRREMAQRRAATQFATVLNPTTQANSGHVRSSTGAAKSNIASQVVPAVARAYSPKPLNWEGRGKAKRTIPSRAVSKAPLSPEHLTGAAGTDPHTADSLRSKLARTWANGRPNKGKSDDT